MEVRDPRMATLEFHRAALAALREAYLALVTGGAQSYAIGSRNVTKLDLGRLSEEMKEHQKAIIDLEVALCLRKRRRAVGVVARDW